ncbi:unnamed protein product [Arabidopsis lyrata]|nr:unnamed protein product [Arabidopsis lyrata]
MTTISDLPRNLVGKILSMVPITCLGAVRCTCKGWNALSKVRILCKAETRHQFVGFIMKKYKLCSVRFDLFDNEREFVDPSVKELGDFPEEIQPRSAYHRFDIYAIGYDNNGKHKILRFVDDHEIDEIFGHEIYDLSSNSWRVLDDITPNFDMPYQRGASLKGNTYFMAKEKIVYQDDGEYPAVPPDNLLCFDFTKESFGQFLPLPFHHYPHDAGALSSLRDEKLAALYQSEHRSEVEIWVTTMIEPNAVLWIPFLKVDMEPHYGFDFMFRCDGGSFFIDEEKKVAVVIHFDESEVTRHEDAAYIIGDNGYVKKVHLGEAVPHIPGALDFSHFQNCCPLVTSCSYVPSLVQINQTALQDS